MLLSSGNKILYVLRAVNDAAIVWYEGIPEGERTEEKILQWGHLSEQTGVTMAEIMQDITGFYPIPKAERV
jgi:hypothetical protein